jgi:hypothetical protein
VNYQKLLLATAIAAIAGGGIATSVMANQSDTSAYNPANPPGNWSINPPGGDGITINPGTEGGSTVTGRGITISGPPGFNLPPGIIDLIAGAIGDPNIKTATGTRRSTGLNEGDDIGEIKLSFNDIAELIQNDLNKSIAELAAAEAAAEDGTSGPRRIARRSGVSDAAAACENSDSTVAVTGARQTLNRKLEDSRKFIEQMNSVNPNRNVW